MRHVVLGMGGIGGLVGAALAAVNEQVRFVARPSTVAGYPHTEDLVRRIRARIAGA